MIYAVLQTNSLLEPRCGCPEISSDQITTAKFLHFRSREPCPEYVYVYKSLSGEKFVFVCHDAVLKPLLATYDGPFRVIRRKGKNLLLDENGKKD